MVSNHLIAQKSRRQTEPIRYYPGKEWTKKTPGETGVNATQLKTAIDFAIASESAAPKDLKLNHYRSFGREPFGDAVGPLKDRGEQTGIIIKNGYVIAEWGDPSRIDITNSVTKSFLATVVGLAHDRKLINSIDDQVYKYVPPILLYNPMPTGDKADAFDKKSDFIEPFNTPHNRTITWRQMLQQNSDWEGTLWGKPDWADRPSNDYKEWATKRNEPGTVYEYNDTRVNALALATLSVWRKPLPDVLKEEVMDPIGASNTWRWYGYENSWIVLDGKIVQSVSGGGHWGGGMVLNAYDMARFGYLTLNNGKWNDRQLVSAEWNKLAQSPSAPQPTYGFMNWFLNTDKKQWPSAPDKAFGHVGNGTNLIYVDPVNDLVVVLRWIEDSKIDEFLKLLLAANK
ncbi:serine hydrolase [Chryseolinea sp. T2]|uniref:serine hydrolase domain-containing protein n=1 Tax=Chryseolinea sp. T2 TaxID=3129255 RepID=UPI0030779DDE